MGIKICQIFGHFLTVILMLVAFAGCSQGLKVNGILSGSDNASSSTPVVPSPTPSSKPSPNPTPSSSPVGNNSIKFHPGWYIELDPNHNTPSSWIKTMHSLKGTPHLVGFYLIKTWRWFEPSENVYTSGSGDTAGGFAALDQLLAEAQADGFQFIMALDGKAFGSTPCTGNCGQVPSYFDTLNCSDGAPGYISGVAKGGTVFTIKAYDPAVTARYVALLAAYGQRYDGNPNFEMFRDSTESANSLLNSGQVAALPPQYIAWSQGGRKAFPHTNLSLSINFMNTAAQLAQIFNGVLPYGTFIGGPDTIAHGMSSYVPGSGKFDGVSNIVFNGYIGSDGTPNTAIDYRGKLGWIAETQTPEETFDMQTPLETYNAMFGVTAGVAQGGESFGGNMRPQYFVFSFGFFKPNSWAASDITSFIAGDHPVNSSPPSTMLNQP